MGAIIFKYTRCSGHMMGWCRFWFFTFNEGGWSWTTSSRVCLGIRISLSVGFRISSNTCYEQSIQEDYSKKFSRCHLQGLLAHPYQQNCRLALGWKKYRSKLVRKWKYRFVIAPFFSHYDVENDMAVILVREEVKNVTITNQTYACLVCNNKVNNWAMISFIEESKYGSFNGPGQKLTEHSRCSCSQSFRILFPKEYNAS